MLHAVDKLRLLVEAITHAVVDTIHLALDVGKIGGQDVAVNDTGTGVAIAAPVAAPAAAEGEQEQDDDPEQAAVTPAKTTIRTGICRLNRHSHHRRIGR